MLQLQHCQFQLPGLQWSQQLHCDCRPKHEREPLVRSSGHIFRNLLHPSDNIGSVVPAEKIQEGAIAADP